MSTNSTVYRSDPSNRLYAEGFTQNAIFGAFYNLVECRRKEGITKAAIAERMDADRTVVTKLTTAPTNMKITTMASLANALDADIVFILMDRKQKGRIFTSIGSYVIGHGTSNVITASYGEGRNFTPPSLHMTQSLAQTSLNTVSIGNG
jgi:transcriptional regulator with XRE-family HTH domain